MLPPRCLRQPPNVRIESYLEQFKAVLDFLLYKVKFLQLYLGHTLEHIRNLKTLCFRDDKAVSGKVEECTEDTTPTRIPTWTSPHQ